jgi:hypothetical protein
MKTLFVKTYLLVSFAREFADALSNDEIESDKNDLIEVLQEYYAEKSNFLNLQINGNNMSIETGDYGVVHLKKQLNNH